MMSIFSRIPTLLALALASLALAASAADNGANNGASNGKGMPGNPDQRFAQLETLLPTPGTTRSASGAPGPAYWQQRADYRIKARLDEQRHRITATQTITYTNRSPDALSYLWLQLDQNIFSDE